MSVADEWSYVEDWSPVSWRRYRQAQKGEREYWRTRDPESLSHDAKYYFYAGFYYWTKHGELLNPFRVDPSRPQNFQIAASDMAGRTVLDVGCGPRTPTLSLVHCASVHVVDPLLGEYQKLQPFGWEFFNSVSPTAAETLPFEEQCFDFVYCWNVLDHVKDADRVLREIARVLRSDGRLLLGCDVRRVRGGGRSHPYKWDLETFEARIFSDFTPVRAAALFDQSRNWSLISRDASDQRLVWVCEMRKKPT